MSTTDVIVAMVGVLLISAGLALAGLMAWLAVQGQLRRHHTQGERLLAEARLQWHTHQAMQRLYAVARQAQTQRSSQDAP